MLSSSAKEMTRLMQFSRLKLGRVKQTRLNWVCCMIGINVVRKWFLAPPIGGSGALLLGISAVVLPTLVRAIAQPVVTGIPLETYVPFILLSAIALDWRHAAIVA